MIGTIEEVKLAHAVSTFFRAYGIHPTTEERVRLELLTDFDERVEVVRAFRTDPGSPVHYLTWNGPSARSTQKSKT